MIKIWTINIILHCLIMTSTLYGDKTVIKTVTVNQMLHADKSIEEVKELAIKKAKFEAAKEIFGEILLSETVMENGQIINEFVREKSGGVIHVKGEPRFQNGQNMGDIQVTIEAYATDADIKDTTPQSIILNDFKYSNSDVPIKKLKALAEDAYIIEALSIKKPSIKDATPAQARKFAVSINISKMDFDMETFTYTISGEIKYIPAFLRHSDIIEGNSITNINDKTYIKPKPKKREGFYGVWSGFIMRTDGSSTQVEIKITKSGQSKITFPMLSCGGDLLVQQKDLRYVEFKELLNYGQDECLDKLKIVLIKVDDNQLKYKEFSQEGEKIAKGVLYRDEIE